MIAHNPRKNYTAIALIWGKIILSLMMAATLLLLTAPSWLQPLKPALVLVLVLFWHNKQPKKMGITIAWIVGLFMDTLMSQALGLNALIYASSCYTMVVLHSQFKNNTGLMHFLIIFIILYVSAAIEVIMSQNNSSTQIWSYLVIILQSLVGTIIWSILSFVFRR